MRRKSKSSKRTPVGIELFCGCGGLSTGFLDEGVRIAAGFDVDRRAIEAYEYNHSYRGSKGVVADLGGKSGSQLLEMAGVSKIDLLVGGPPCQPFSIVGKRRGLSDERADMVFHFLRYCRELRPEAVLFENVPNLARIDDGNLLAKLGAELRRIDYEVATRVVLAADFGVPQYRRRLILVALRGQEFKFPDPTHGQDSMLGRNLMPHVGARAAIGDLPDAGYFGECGVYNHEPTEHTADMLLRLSRLEPGCRERGSFHDRLHPDRPSFTLRAGTGNFSPLRPIHYKFDRVITVRESARLQGFGDQFIWPDWIPRLQQYRQVGNAVPPPLAATLARSLLRQLGWRRDKARLHGKPELRAPAITMTDDERRALRRSRIRGASLGGKGRRT